jgi:hypothetical protein
MPRRSGTFWPSPTQELLLKVGLRAGDEALAAWEELRLSFDLQTLEPGTFAALPLVYRTLGTAAPDDPLLPRLKGIYRSTWVKNNLLVERLDEIAAALAGDGVEPIVVGSLGSALRYYSELGLRPTPSVELLVGPRDLLRATRTLGRLGLSAPGPIDGDVREPVSMSDADGRVVVLRTSAAVELELGIDTLAPVAVPLALRERTLPALLPGDDLLAACVAGGRAGPVRSVQWIVDAAHILRGTELDWPRLLALAAEQGQILRLARALDYLADDLGEQLPPGADALFAHRATRRERLAYALSGSAARGLGSFPQALGEHVHATRDRPALASAAALPESLRRRWNLQQKRQLPVAGGRRAVRMLSRKRERST